MDSNVCSLCDDLAQEGGFRCCRCFSWQHRCCDDRGKRGKDLQFTLCHTCRMEKPHKDRPPQWVKVMAGVDFGDSCQSSFLSRHFRTFCSCGFCKMCFPGDAAIDDKTPSPRILVKRHETGMLMVDETSIAGLFDDFSVCCFTSSWVLLDPDVRPRQPLEQQGILKWEVRYCNRCGRQKPYPKKYCSVSCQYGAETTLRDQLTKIGRNEDAYYYRGSDEFLQRLLGHVFTDNDFIPHHRDYFCVPCRAAGMFGLVYHDAHSPLVSIIKRGDNFFILIRGEEEWHGTFAKIQGDSGTYDGVPCLFVPLKRPPAHQRLAPWKGCQCGNHIATDMWYCSVTCLLKYWSVD